MSIRPLLVLFPAIALAAPETHPAVNGLTRTLVAKEPLLKNPVSVSVDVDGTVYVTETARRKAADLDIREFMPWVTDDLSHTSVEDKLAFFKEQLVPGKFDKHASLKDHNKDGKVDIDDLTAITEKIIRFTDSDGDGVMDASETFAEDFNTPVTGIAAGVFAWRGDVYSTIAPDVWKLRDTDGDGKADKRESIAHGFGLHIAYAGHDMHGLTWGPDGKLYWSIGDKGTNVMSKEGKRWFAPHEGAVLRCNPDGTGFEIFARGLRNPQEIAFDDYGNWFSVDNDADKKGERERLVYITEGSDTGWRCYYQYRKDAYDPWMAESICVPSGPNQPAYITPPLANYGDGPAGFAYNPGAALNDRYKGSFFLSEFPKGELQSFKAEENGASFKIADAHTVVKGPMLIGINFGPDGALYAADWAGGYPLKEKGAIWKLDDATQNGNAIRKEVADFLKKGPTDVSTPELTARLSHIDQRIRLDAQWKLARRKAIPELKGIASNTSSTRLPVIHALWGLSQTGTFDAEIFSTLTSGNDAELRAQAAKWAGETSKGAQPILGKLLADPSLRVRAHAANAIGKLHLTEHLDAVIAMLAENAGKDVFLRQAGVMALSGMDIEKVAAKSIKHDSPAVRIAAAVAFRRTSSPHAAELLNDADPAVVSEAARAIYDSPGIPDAMPALAALISEKASNEVPAIRRAIAANRRTADPASAARLIRFASDASNHEALRVAALEALATWDKTPELDFVDGRYEPFKKGDQTPATKSAVTPVINFLKHDPSDAIAIAAAEVASAFGIAADPKELAKEATDASATPAARVRALKLLRRTDVARFVEIAPTFLKNNDSTLRSAAAELLATTSPQQVIAYIKSTVSSTTAGNAERQNAVKLLLLVREDGKAKKLLSDLLAASIEKPDGPILLELLDVADTVKAKAGKTLRDQLSQIHPHLASLEGGDAAAGSKVFNENLASQCLACHRIGPEGSNVGPALTKIGEKGRDYILESIVDPGAKLAPGFGMMSATLKSGTTVAGAIKEETADTLVLALPDGTTRKVAIKDIADRTPPMSTMPPMATILTPKEIRDVVEYLTTLK
jgi:quinoprotein glucose dehydrogenase